MSFQKKSDYNSLFSSYNSLNKHTNFINVPLTLANQELKVLTKKLDHSTLENDSLRATLSKDSSNSNKSPSSNGLKTVKNYKVHSSNFQSGQFVMPFLHLNFLTLIKRLIIHIHEKGFNIRYYGIYAMKKSK